MHVRDAITARRAYRSLEKVEVTRGMIDDLATCASLAPSCFNSQPWRFAFVPEGSVLDSVRSAFSKGNEWAEAASMVIAVYAEKEADCDIEGREYYLFDTGLSAAFIILRATEMGLVAHPIAGFDEERVKEILNIPGRMTVITLIVVGRRMDGISPVLSRKQVAAERSRPARLAIDDIVTVYSI